MKPHWHDYCKNVYIDFYCFFMHNIYFSKRNMLSQNWAQLYIKYKKSFSWLLNFGNQVMFFFFFLQLRVICSQISWSCCRFLIHYQEPAHKSNSFWKSDTGCGVFYRFTKKKRLIWVICSFVNHSTMVIVVAVSHFEGCIFLAAYVIETVWF